MSERESIQVLWRLQDSESIFQIQFNGVIDISSVTTTTGMQQGQRHMSIGDTWELSQLINDAVSNPSKNMKIVLELR